MSRRGSGLPRGRCRLWSTEPTFSGSFLPSKAKTARSLRGRGRVEIRTNCLIKLDHAPRNLERQRPARPPGLRAALAATTGNRTSSACRNSRWPTSSFPTPNWKPLATTSVVHGQKAWNGVAILARERGRGHAGRTSRPGGVRCPADHARTSRACPSRPSTAQRQRRSTTTTSRASWPGSTPLREHLERTHDAGRPRSSAATSTSARRRSTAGTRSGPARLDLPHRRGARAHRRSSDSGLHDVFREQHPDEQAFSWWDYRGGAFHRNQGLRIDFLLATPPHGSRAQRRDRPRLPQEEGRADTLRSHAGDGRTGRSRSRLIDRRPLARDTAIALPGRRRALGAHA